MGSSPVAVIHNGAMKSLDILLDVVVLPAMEKDILKVLEKTLHSIL